MDNPMPSGRAITAFGCLIFLAGFALALVLAAMIWGCAPRVCEPKGPVAMTPEARKVCEP